MTTYTIDDLNKAYDAWYLANAHAQRMTQSHPANDPSVIEAWKREEAALARYTQISEAFHADKETGKA